MISKRTSVLRNSFFLLIALAIWFAVSSALAERTGKGTRAPATDRRSGGLAAFYQGIPDIAFVQKVVPFTAKLGPTTLATDWQHSEE
jgi:hypothetical protein